MLTFEEVVERLKQLDEITLVELLDLSSEELVDRNIDIIEDNFEKFQKAVD